MKYFLIACCCSVAFRDSTRDLTTPVISRTGSCMMRCGVVWVVKREGERGKKLSIGKSGRRRRIFSQKLDEKSSLERVEAQTLHA